MWKTALFLLITLIIIPFFAFKMEDPLTMQQGAVLKDLLLVYLAASVVAFLLSLFTGNYSQVDKLWSTIPIAYVWIVAFQTDFEQRIVLMAVMVTAWGLRLSYNFSRRGGYSWKFWTGEEDYRWSILHAKPEFAAKWKWFLFNLFFISFYQMAIILLMTLPIIKSMEGEPTHWTDFLVAALMLVFIITETIADQQQWNFQKEKIRMLEAGEALPEKYKKGFVSTGLWSLVRHPNYASEQAVWITFYFFSVSASGMWLNWSIMGALLLVILFFGSSNFSESISAGKYPDYKIYQQKVPRFLPLRFRGKSI